MATPDLVLIGHLAEDLLPDGTYRLGGTVTYAGLLAARLGLRPAILTSAPATSVVRLAALLPEALIQAVPSTTPTIFENRYLYRDSTHPLGSGSHRVQHLRGRATTLTAAALPPGWDAAPLTLLGPIADEIAPDLVAALRGPQRAATPQGWLRQWDAAGLVAPRPWITADAILPYLTTLILSIEDLAIASGETDPIAVLRDWTARVPLVALTAGPAPLRLWSSGRELAAVPAFPANEVDPTGAGDCFALAFLFALDRGDDPAAAARFAHTAAAAVVAAPGLEGIPTLAEIAARLYDG